MKQTKLNLLSALLLVTAMAFGTSAWATTKTVTYTITDVEEGNSSTTITFTRSGNTPFGGGSTTYTVTVSNSYLGQNGGQGNFSVDLADGFHLNLSWQAGSNIGFTNHCIRPQASGKQITYNVLCNDANYYVTHLKLTGLEGTSPVVEACPFKRKAAAMSLVHSFYCWGQMAVVLGSTLFFRCFGLENWRLLALVWAAVPLFDGIFFLFVPMRPLIAEGKQGLGDRKSVV